jgi:hypothetical protein
MKKTPATKKITWDEFDILFKDFLDKEPTPTNLSGFFGNLGWHANRQNYFMKSLNNKGIYVE